MVLICHFIDQMVLQINKGSTYFNYHCSIPTHVMREKIQDGILLYSPSCSLSTCMRALATLIVNTDSCLVKTPFVKSGGKLSDTPCGIRSWIRKPLWKHACVMNTPWSNNISVYEFPICIYNSLANNLVVVFAVEIVFFCLFRGSNWGVCSVYRSSHLWEAQFHQKLFHVIREKRETK